MIQPHGGRLVNKVLGKKEVRALLKGQKKMLHLSVDHDALLDLENIAMGVYSPLRGFMNRQEFNAVTVHKRLPSGPAWTIPVVLGVAKEKKTRIGLGERALLCSQDHQPIGIIKIEDIYSVNKHKAARRIFGVTTTNHPGVNKFYGTGDLFVGGEIWLIRPNKYPFHSFNLKPAQTRQLIKEKGWRTIAGFQTRNIPHRAHEFLQKIGLSLVDGILIHPIIGWKKKGDFNPKMIIDAYQILIDHYYPKDRVVFSGLATAMRYAGPLEAVFHAIIRKNFGCTHFIVGRDHAGVGSFYDKYAAHRIFDKFSDLGIVPMLLNGPYYCKKCLSVVSDEICPHHGKFSVEISGTLIREMLSRNKRIPEEYLRQEVADFIHRHRNSCFI